LSRTGYREKDPTISSLARTNTKEAPVRIKNAVKIIELDVLNRLYLLLSEILKFFSRTMG